MNIYSEQYKDFSDEILMNLIEEGDTSAFDELYGRYSKRLLYFFLRMLGNDKETAEDFLQEIFLKVVDKPYMFKSERRFSTWIYTVAHNMCKCEYRRRDVRKNTKNGKDMDAIFIDEGNGESKIEIGFDRKEFKKTLFSELEGLNDNQKTIFLLRYQEHFSIKEISKVVRCSEGTVKSRLFYAQKKLAEKLREFNPKQDEA